MGLRRSVATICVLWPAVPRVALAEASCGADLCVRLLRKLGPLLLRLHEAGTAHCCLSPSSIFLNDQDEFFLGDFLPKIRLLSLLNGTLKAQDEDSSFWPPEVRERLAGGKEKEKAWDMS